MRWLVVLVACMAAACGGDSLSGPSPSSPADFTGTWALQTNASSSCASRLPTLDRNRNYLVTATQAAGQVTFSPIPATNSLISVLISGVPSGNTLFGQMEIVDGVLSGDVFSAQGSFGGTLSGTVINATMNGSFQDRNDLNAICTAADHQITLTKR